MKSIHTKYTLIFLCFFLLCTSITLAKEQQKQASFWQQTTSFVESLFSPSPATKAMLAPNLLVDSRVSETNPGANEVFIYKVRYRCASTTEHCTNAYIELALADSLDIISTTPIGGNIANITTTNQIIRFDLASPPSAGAPAGQLAAGSSGIIDIRVKFKCRPIGAATQTPTAGSTINLDAPATFHASGQSSVAPLPPEVTVPTLNECTPPPATSNVFDKTDLENNATKAQAGGTFSYQIDLPDTNATITITDTISTDVKVYKFDLDRSNWEPNWTVECNCGSGWKAISTAYAQSNNWIWANTASLNDLPDINGAPTGCSVTYNPNLDAYEWDNLIALRYTTPNGGAANPAGIRIHVKINEEAPVGTVIQNCAVGSGSMGSDCYDISIVEDPTFRFLKYPNQTLGTTAVHYDVHSNFPITQKEPDDIIWRVIATYDDVNGQAHKGIVIEDSLGTGLEYVIDGDQPNWWVVYINDNAILPPSVDPYNQPDCHQPIFTTESVNGKIKKLRWEFPNCILPTGYNTEPSITVIFTSRYDRSVAFDTNLSNNACLSLSDGSPFYRDGVYLSDGKATTAHSVNTSGMSGGDLVASKWVKGTLDNDFHRYPSVGNTNLAGEGVYELFIYNYRMDDDIQQLDIIDILPHMNDLDLIGGGNRGSNWSAEIANAITIERLSIPSNTWVDATPNLAGGILYSNSYEPCYIENIGGFDYAFAKTNLTEPSAACSTHADSTFSNTNSPTGAKSFAFSWQNNADPLQFGEGLRIKVNIQQLTGEADKTNGEIAWNSFAYTAIQADGDTLLSSEPIKVGLKMIDPDAFASLGNFVWMDENANGIQDGTEKGIEGVTVRLYDNAGAPILVGGEPLTAQTDSNGYYCFVGLTPNMDYIIRLDEPIDFINSGALNQLQLTQLDVGTDNSLDSDAALGNNAGADTELYPQIVASTPAAGEEDKSFDFGFFKGATIGNYLWFDEDGEGDQDNNELALDSLRVELLDQDGNIVLVDSTDVNGYYRFDQVTPGTYRVRFPDFPDSLTFTSPNLTGNIETDSDVMSDSTTILFSIAACENNQTIDAGFRLPPADPATIKGTTWEDLDKDGIRQGTEPLLSGVTVQLLDDVGLPIQSAVTDTNGRYCFNNLVPDDTYQVVFSIGVNRTFTLQSQGGDPTIDSDALPADGTTAAVTPTTNEIIDGIDAGICSPLSLGNLVWEDVNNNGLYENGEPTLANITVYLIDGTDGTTYLDTTTTDANGRYLFGDLSAGDYIVEVEIPTGMESTMDVGSTPTPNQVDSDDNGVGTASTGRVQSAVMTLANNGGTNGDANWTESDGDAFIHGMADPTPNPKAYYTVDFGFYTPCLISIQSVTPSNCDSTTNNYHLTVELDWSNAPVGKIQLATNNGDTTTVSPAGTTGAQSFLWENLTADGVNNITLTASFVNNTNCTASLTNAYNAPVACVEGCRLKVLYLCGNNKHEDAYAWDHGMIRYLETLEGIGSITGAFTKNSGADLGLFDPENNNDPVTIDVTEFDCLFISNSVGTNYKQELSNALRELPTPMILMNRHMLDDFGMAANNHAAQINQNDAYDGTNQVQLYDFATYNPNPTYDPVVIYGDYLPSAEVYLWLNNTAHTNGNQGLFFTYDETDVLTNPNTASPYPHGQRTFLGYTVDALYQNATDNSIPSPESAWLDPDKHFTPAGKYYMDQALMMGGKPCEDSCSVTIVATYHSNCTPITNGHQATLNVVVNWNLPPINEMISVSLDGANAQTIDVINTVSPDTLQFTIPADGSAHHAILAQFETSTACSDSAIIKYPVPCPTNLGSAAGDICTHATDAIAGTVFEDWNYDGLMNQSDTIGVAGILVTATDCNGNVDTTYTDANGNYQFTGLTNGDDYRIEFSLPEAVSCWACPTHAGGDNGTMIQFVQVGDCAHLGVSSPADYCVTNNPLLMTPCYVNGDPLGGSTSGDADVVVSFDYNNTGSTPTPNHLARADSMGSVWGLAYHQEKQELFASAFLKRHVGLGPLGTGGIYRMDMTAASIQGEPFIDLQALGINTGSISNRNLPAEVGSASVDSLAFFLVGTVGLGDMDISDDGKTLYVVNLYEKQIIAIDISPYLTNGSLPTATDLTIYPIPDPGCWNSTANTAAPQDARPFALKYYRGNLYVGVVCSAYTSQQQTDVTATVYQFNPTNGQFLSVLNFDLDYDRWWQPQHFNNCSWKPWVNDPNQFYEIESLGVGACLTQAVLSDIEFDVDGAMILGIFDRGGHQLGADNRAPISSDANLYNYDGKGDIIRAHDQDGQYYLENNATSGHLTGCDPNSDLGGPGGGEFFCDFGTGGHPEMSHGGLAILKGSGEVANTHGNPTENYSGGVLYFNRKTGEQVDRYRIYDRFSSGGFAKAHGTGDLEMACGLAPIEIGNYIWVDTNSDGIQDACEPPLENVVVTLYDSGCKICAIDTTDAFGNYYFNDAKVKEYTAEPDTALSPNNTYYLVITGAVNNNFNTANGELTVGNNTYVLTSTDQGNNDQIDNDGAIGTACGSLTDFPFATVQTTKVGCNDHSYDFGFKALNSCPPINCIPVQIEKIAP